MPGRTMSATVGVMALLAATACGRHTQTDHDAKSTEHPTEVASAPNRSSSTSPARTDETSPSSALRIATARDVRLIRDFVAFAVQPSATTAEPLPFAAQVRLGLSRALRSTAATSSIPQASAWRLEAKYFRAYVGPFSALALVQRHAHETKSQSVRRRGGNAFDVSVGDHPHCAGPPLPAPRGFEDFRRVSVQPSTESIDSCLAWFTVDLFVDQEGRIAAVTLDIWEP